MSSRLSRIVRRVILEDIASRSIYGSKFSDLDPSVLSPRVRDEEDPPASQAAPSATSYLPANRGRVTLSPGGYAWLVKREAIVPYVYDDDRGRKYFPKSWDDFRGYATIGLGVRVYPRDHAKFAPYLNGNPMPESELNAVNQQAITTREDELNKLLSGVPITQSMFDALFWMMYNTGSGSRKFVEAIAALKRQPPDYTAAQQAIAAGPVTSKGKYRKSLAERRALEAAEFMRQGIPNPGAAQASQKSSPPSVGYGGRYGPAVTF